MIRCYLIGEDSLVVQCASILLQQNHLIESIVSTLPSVQKWAKKQGICSFSTLDDLLGANPPVVDYIFSIVNGRILTTSVINLAIKGVINYHDSPLPKYAGLNSTFWAIINNEKSHGVTWHWVNEEIDAGDIIYQSVFDITSEETSLSLNLRCYWSYPH